VAGAIEILAVRGLAMVQDAGRPGWMHQGVPPGGFLVPELAARANLGAGNAVDAPLLEVFGGLTLTTRESSARVCTEDGVAREIAPGETFDVAPSPSLRVRYVAASGGLDVPPKLGGRGTLLVARLGGHEGRALAKGDRLPLGAATATSGPAREPAPLDLASAVRVLAGPDLTRFDAGALATLASGSFTVERSSDRAGTRLTGPRLCRRDTDTGRSSPMVRGAIQVPASEEPIVLGPDHPTTGGYPVIGVIVQADLGNLYGHPIGASVRFTVVSLDEARALVLA